MSFEQKLLQMKKLLKKEPSQLQQTPSQHKNQPMHSEAWKKIGLELIENEFGFLYRKKTVYKYDHVHGTVTLSDLFRVLSNWEDSGLEHPFSITGSNKLLFFDTETTGLGGTGAFIFLIGILQDSKDGYFELDQYVLPDPSQEAAFLYETGFWSDDKTIFSYNGKSFDWPQLSSRWMLYRNIIPKLKNHRQIDLFHGTKRIWKNDLAKMKLSIIEEEKLGFVRKGDVSGHLIPAIYLDAVKSGNPQALHQVMIHNEWDILSLVALYVRTSDLLLEDLHSETPTAYTNIGKWYADLKEFQQSTAYFENVSHSHEEEQSALARYYLGIQKKRQQLYDESVDLFIRAAPYLTDKLKAESYIHASKLFEHQFKDYKAALEMVDLAEEAVNSSSVFTPKQMDNYLQSLLKRRSRILGKLHSRSFPGEAQETTEK